MGDKEIEYTPFKDILRLIYFRLNNFLWWVKCEVKLHGKNTLAIAKIYIIFHISNIACKIRIKKTFQRPKKIIIQYYFFVNQIRSDPIANVVLLGLSISNLKFPMELSFPFRAKLLLPSGVLFYPILQN